MVLPKAENLFLLSRIPGNTENSQGTARKIEPMEIGKSNSSKNM